MDVRERSKKHGLFVIQHLSKRIYENIQVKMKGGRNNEAFFEDGTSYT